MAPTKRALPEDFTGPDRPVVVTTDGAGKLTIDPNVAKQQPLNKLTLRISAEDSKRLRSAKERSDAAKRAGDAEQRRARNLSKPTAPMPAAAQRERVAESIAVTPAPIKPRRRTPTPTPPELPRIGAETDEDEEPTLFEEVLEAPPALEVLEAPPALEVLRSELSAETVMGEPGARSLATAPDQEEPTAIDDPPEAAHEVVEEDPTHIDDQPEVASEVVEEDPTHIDDEPSPAAADEVLAPPRPTEGSPMSGEDGAATVRLSTMEMMGRLSAMGSIPPREIQSVTAAPDAGASTSPDSASSAPAEAAGAPLKKRGTAPGFQSTGEFVPPDPHDALRFIRTTRRYASVEIPPDDEVGDETVVQSLDPGLVSSVMRMDAAASKSEPRRSSKGYAAIQREVRQDGRKQEDRELPTAEVEAAVEDLRDTIRELPGEPDPLSNVNEQARTPFPLFSDLDTAAFLAMVEKLERRECAAGSLVFQEGDPGDSLYLVSSGTLQVLKLDEEHHQIELAILGAGSFFGEFGMLTDRRRHASVRCLDDCELLELRREVLAELIQQHPSISWTLRIFYQQRLMAMVLATSPLFQAVSPEDRRAVLSRFTIRRILEGETIIEEGMPTNGFYVILVGGVSISCTAEDALEVPLGKLSEGDYFGEISLLTGSFPAATVRANQLTEVLTLNARDFYDLTTTHPEIWAEVQRKADHRQQETAARLAKRHKAAGPIPLI